MKTVIIGFRKFSMLLCTTCITSLLLTSPSFADVNSTTEVSSAPVFYGQTSMTNYFLSLIVGSTAAIFQLLNEAPAYSQELAIMAKSWNTTSDKNNVLGINQFSFAGLSNYNSQIENMQTNTAKQYTKQFIRGGTNNPNKSILLSNANDLTYSIILHNPIFLPNGQEANLASDIDRATIAKTDYSANIQNYILNASGSTLQLDQPNSSWQGDKKAIKQYTNLYNTLVAVESYDQYLINGLAGLKDSRNYSNQLMAQASNPRFFANIGSEALGLVLRHILLYVSQSFVQMARIVELQQKQLAIQAMTNSLLIIMVQGGIGTQLQMQAKNAPRQTS